MSKRFDIDSFEHVGVGDTFVVIAVEEIPASATFGTVSRRVVVIEKQSNTGLQSDTKACDPGTHELFKSEEIWRFCPNCGQRL